MIFHVLQNTEHDQHGTLLTYTTVQESHDRIALQENFQRSRSTGTDSIEVNVEERSFVFVSDMSRYCSNKPLGCINSVPGRYN